MFKGQLEQIVFCDIGSTLLGSNRRIFPDKDDHEEIVKYNLMKGEL
jgi:hypothetical protein